MKPLRLFSSLTCSLATLACALALTGCLGEWSDDGAYRRPRVGDHRTPAPDAVSGDPAVIQPSATPEDPNHLGWDPAPQAPNAEPATPAPDPYATPAPVTPQPASARVHPTTPPPLPPGAKAAGGSPDDPLFYDFTGKEPPDLDPSGVWLTPGVAKSLAGLRGQVVFLQFAFQTCPSCGQMTPYLQQWHEMFGPKGLTILYVNNGLMANQAAAEAAIQNEGLKFPYFHDTKGETLRAFGVRSFPMSYIIDKSGKVLWCGTPTASESRITDLLASLVR